MKFQPGNKVRYIEETDCLTNNAIYVVKQRSRNDQGIHLEGFDAEGDWWYDWRFELAEETPDGFFAAFITESRKVPCGSYWPKYEHFTKVEKIGNEEELKAWIEAHQWHNLSYEIFKCVKVGGNND